MPFEPMTTCAAQVDRGSLDLDDSMTSMKIVPACSSFEGVARWRVASFTQSDVCEVQEGWVVHPSP